MNYRVISFGSNGYGFWNEPTFHSKFQDACERFATMANCQNPEFLGAVLVEVNHEDFKVLHRVGPDCYEVTYNFGVVRVKNKEKELVVCDM